MRPPSQRGVALLIFIARAVALGDVRDFVRQYRSQLAFVVADAKQRGMQHHVAAEEGEGVDLVVAHQIEMERCAHRISAGHQPVAQLVDVLAQQRCR